jgi:hypothetical protein
LFNMAKDASTDQRVQKYVEKAVVQLINDLKL